MPIFLIFPNKYKDIMIEPKRVAKRLTEVFDPLFQDLPKPVILTTDSATLIYLNPSVRGWKTPHFQESHDTWALAPQYPIDAGRVLASRDIKVPDRKVLPALGKALVRDTRAVLRELSPRFLLIWGDKDRDEIRLQTDGLGYSELYHYESKGLWAYTNKIFALKALDIALELEIKQWGVRWALRYFPLDLTGYKSIKFVKSASQIVIRGSRPVHQTTDVLSDWLNRDALVGLDAPELARNSLHEYIGAFLPQASRFQLSLTGGWDTRTVVAAFRAKHSNLRCSVSGLPGRADVVIAKQLAAISGIDLHSRGIGVLPSSTIKDCRESIRKAIVWQAGYRTVDKHKMFQSHGHRFGRSSVVVGGYFGGVFKSYLLRRGKIGATGEGATLDALVTLMLKHRNRYQSRRQQQFNLEVVEQACRQVWRTGGDIGLSEAENWNLYNMLERCRRREAHSVFAKHAFIFTPLLNPGFIRAYFASTLPMNLDLALNRHILRTDAPDWEQIPFAGSAEPHGLLFHPSEDSEGSLEDVGEIGDWRLPTSRRNYSPDDYWREVGKELFEEATERDGPWRTIFDLKKVRKRWQKNADAIVVSHILAEEL
jgi:hypothetical protein